jgi:O-antigen ligase
MTLAIQELLLFLSLGFAVVAFGANPDWARHIFCMLVFFAGAFIVLIAPPAPASRSFRRSVTILAALMAIPVLQLIPLPSSVQQALTPVHAAMMQKLAQTGVLEASLAHRTASIHPFGTLEQYAVVLAAGLLFFVGRRLFMDAGSLKRLAWFFLGLGFLESLYGLIQYLGKIPHPFLQPGYELATVASGTYVNRNHFAGLLEMVFPVVIAVAYAHFLTRIHPDIRYTRRRFRVLMTHPDMPLFCLFLFIAVWVCLGIIFSMSRTGITGMLVTSLFLALLLGIRHSRHRIQLVGLVFLLAVAGYAGYIGMEEVLQRFEQLLQEDVVLQEGRVEVWRDSITLIRDFPLTGVGLGNYQHAFHKYNRVPRNVIYDHAHNDYLEYLSEWGLPAGLLLIGSVLVIFGRGLLAFFRVEDNPMLQAMLLGTTGGIFSLLLHSLTDFNLQIPANLALFTLLLAATAAMTEQEAAERAEFEAEDGPAESPSSAGIQP